MIVEIVYYSIAERDKLILIVIAEQIVVSS